MRAVIQRSREARVDIDGRIVGAIDRGLVVLLGVGQEDSAADVKYLAEKIVNLRIFEDENGKMNRSLLEVRGQAPIVSQFTLWGDSRKGRRPSFTRAAPPEIAEKLYLDFIDEIGGLGVATASGRFGAMMEVHLVNDGPVTLILDSQRNF